jgi:hypothetical protein
MRSQNCTGFVYVVTFNVISPYTQEKLTETKCVTRRETDNWQKKSLQKLNVLSEERQTIGKRKAYRN